MTWNLENNQMLLQESSLVNFGVKFLSVVSKHGRLASLSTKGEFELLPEQKREVFFMQASLQDRMLRDFDNDLGKVSYSLIEREHLKFVSIPLRSGILFAVILANANHLAFVQFIKKMLNNSNKFSNNKIVGAQIP